MKAIIDHFIEGFHRASKRRQDAVRRVGAELKFPLVDRQGRAAGYDDVQALWEALVEHGWKPIVDPLTSQVSGARCAGECNDTLVGCETGRCKVEFSLAHASNLHDLKTTLDAIREQLRRYFDTRETALLGYGIQPHTPPGRGLLIKQSRTSFWEEVFGSNRVVPEADGDDVHLFTVNAANQVHVDVAEDEAVAAVNVLNGFAPSQIALNADSNIWRGQIDPHYKCVCEMFWDWWLPDSHRVGMPDRPFSSLEDYVTALARLQPVYVKRDGVPLALTNYRTFADYYFAPAPRIGIATDGSEVEIEPAADDIDLHTTFQWYDARISHYYTLENRVNDQQPPQDLFSVAALTLGLIEVLPEAAEEIRSHEWDALRTARLAACRDGLQANAESVDLGLLASQMLDLAERGLRRRGFGEEEFLAPLWRRFDERRCPADEAAERFRQGGVQALVDARRL